jgi:hypothetical protein
VKIIKSHTITTFVSQLLLAAIVHTLFFGQGVHLHFSVHDLFHHHDSPVVLHSHDSSDEKQDSNDKESHQHSVATIEFNANISNSGQFAISEINKGQSGAVLLDVGNVDYSLTEQFAIPPPLPAASILSTSFLSLRAPPQA